MHERHLMDDLMGKILTVAHDHGAERVTMVEVWLGALSHMSPEHFREHYDEVAAGTIAEGAELRCEQSDDPHHSQANGILLRNVDVL